MKYRTIQYGYWNVEPLSMAIWNVEPLSMVIWNVEPFSMVIWNVELVHEYCSSMQQNIEGQLNDNGTYYSIIIILLNVQPCKVWRESNNTISPKNPNTRNEHIVGSEKR